jgi:hypothetical protein
MFTHYLKYCCSFIVILSFQSAAYADVYKWIDENGQTNFSQQAPIDRESDVIKTRSGTVVTPAQSQQAVDQIIKQQTADAKAKDEAAITRQKEIAKSEVKSKNCDIAKSNLANYQNNPNGRTQNSDGEYIRIDEIERQNKIKQLNQDIQPHCE